MLFLDTCIVEAASSSNTYNFSTVLSPNAVSNITVGASGSTTTHSYSYFSYHVKIPFIYSATWTDLGADFTSYYENASQYFTMCLNDFAVISHTGTISNVTLYVDSTDVLYANAVNVNTYPVFYLRGSNMQSYSEFYANIPLILEYDVQFDSANNYDTFNSTMNIRVGLFSRKALDSELDSARVQVSDEVTQTLLSETVTQNIQAEETRSGILSKISDFFGSFFSNLIGVFVPENGYFSGWFDRVNTLLSQKLGMLYAPFDLVISTLQAIYSADSSETGIPFPGIKWDDTWLVEPFTFTFASLGDSFDDLRDKVYFATDTVLVLTFLMLLQSKVKLILEGHE